MWNIKSNIHSTKYYWAPGLWQVPEIQWWVNPKSTEVFCLKIYKHKWTEWGRARQEPRIIERWSSNARLQSEPDPKSHRHQDTMKHLRAGEGHDLIGQSLFLWRNGEGCDSLPQRESLWEKCPVRDGKFLSCNLSHWKPQARFLVCGMWCQQGQGLLPVAERKEWREEEGTPSSQPSMHTALSTGSPPTLWRQHDVMGRAEAAPRAPLQHPSLLWAALSSRATWEEEELNPELPCSVDTVALWKWHLSQH